MAVVASNSSIWDYADTPVEMSLSLLAKVDCVFCNAPMPLACDTSRESDHVYVRLCNLCGWWHASRLENYRSGILEKSLVKYASYGVLKNLNLADISTPLNEVRDYLQARYSDRHLIHPRLFEETVASVFRGIGYVSETTVYTGDGGIDVVLGNGVERVGVQVKRYRNAIEAEQIRSFLGAMVNRGYTKGIYVTTSRFRSGAQDEADTAAERGFPIELIDADKFYRALGIAQGTLTRSPDEWLHFVKWRLKVVDRRVFSPSSPDGGLLNIL